MKTQTLNWFAQNYPELLLKMESTQHGYLGTEPNPYHLEGSILTHTVMVMSKARELFPNNITLMLTALLHDIGKPDAAEDIHDTKRRRFINHEALSTFIAKPILQHYKKEVNPDIDIQLILKLIAIHGRFYNYFDETGIPTKHHQKIANMFTNDILLFSYMVNFYQCDHLGRIQTTDKTNIDDVLSDFAAIEKLIIYDAPAALHKPNTLTLLIGPPRAGKSSWVSQNASDELIISRDNLVETIGVGNTYSDKWKSLTPEAQKQIDLTIQSKFNIALKTSKDIIVDMTNMSKKSRRKWLSDSKLKTYHKKAVVVIEDLSTLESRNSPDKTIEIPILLKMQKNFVMPLKDEFDEVLFIDL